MKIKQIEESRLRPLSMSRLIWCLSLGLIALIVIGIMAGAIGSVYIPPLILLRIVLDKIPFLAVDNTWPDSWETIIWQIRFPRVLLAALLGGALAISGATYQGLFRNPLADPYLIGVASGIKQLLMFICLFLLRTNKIQLFSQVIKLATEKSQIFLYQ